MKRLEIEYNIVNMSTLYESPTGAWHNAEFIFNKELTANLKMWEDNIEPEQIAETWKKLEERAESFRVALKYRGNHHIIFNKMDYSTYYFNDQKFTLRNKAEIEILIKFLRGEIESFCVMSAKKPMLTISGSEIVSPTPLPQLMPLIPLELHGMATTLVIADELVNYPDLMLKLAYLVLEGLMEEDALKDDIMKHVRDFVSHPICRNPKVVAFVEGELPSAKLNSVVQFKRDKSDHIAFVSKYANLALERAKDLFEAEVEKRGGCIRF
jgi:hypothetical protein